jgi:hypothetical protein
MNDYENELEVSEILPLLENFKPTSLAINSARALMSEVLAKTPVPLGSVYVDYKGGISIFWKMVLKELILYIDPENESDNYIISKDFGPVPYYCRYKPATSDSLCEALHRLISED